MAMDFRSPLDLSVAADHAKSPIRKQEFDQHCNSELHIQNDGLADQMLVMTAVGPRMMTPKLRCQCDGSHYGCDCRIVFDDNPPPPAADVIIRCFKNGNLEVLNESNVLNIPAWTLEYGDVSTFFRFVPEKVFTADLSQLNWAIVDNVAHNLNGTHQVIGGKRCFDLYFDMDSHSHFTDSLVTGAGGTSTGMMPIHIRKTTAKVIQIACGTHCAYFLFEDGTVWSCGNNDYGQLGRNVTSGNPQSPGNLGRITGLPTGAGSRVVQIAATETSFFAVLANGDVWCAGDNSKGQLGYHRATGSATTTNLARNTSVSNVRSVSCGTDFTYFLLNNGEVRSCGNNEHGQLGRQGAVTGSATTSNLGLVSLTNVQRIACGDDFTWFQAGHNDIWTCGNNVSGQLGRGSWWMLPSDPIPAFAWSSPTGILEISCGSQVGYITTGERRAVSNRRAHDMYGSAEFADVGLSGVDQAVASFNTRYAQFVRSGKVWVEGDNSYGQLGLFQNPRTASLQIPWAGNGECVRAFTGGTACYWIRPDGNVMSLGSNGYGQLGFSTPAATGFYGIIEFNEHRLES
ncbi:MAG: hypothetical protein FWH27_09655 [Planctomycetaceae bacterium]|nr:hypothetical protein [Planctomycetaceae bacterium]